MRSFSPLASSAVARPTHRTVLLPAVCVLVILVAGCNTTPPPRPAYNGPDRISTVQPAMLVGSWQVRVLNPVQGEVSNNVTVKYTADGGVVMETVGKEMGMEMSLRMIGRWSASGDTITQTLESIEDMSGKPMNALLRPFMGRLKTRASGTANIYEATRDRVVLVSEHGQAQELTRLP